MATGNPSGNQIAKRNAALLETVTSPTTLIAAFESQMPPPDAPFEDFVSYGQKVGQAQGKMADAMNWIYGDLAARVESGQGEGSDDKLAEALGIKSSTMRNWKRTAVAFPVDGVPRGTSPWSVYRALVAITDEEYRAELAAEPMTKATAEERVKEWKEQNKSAKGDGGSGTGSGTGTGESDGILEAARTVAAGRSYNVEPDEASPGELVVTPANAKPDKYGDPVELHRGKPNDVLKWVSKPSPVDVDGLREAQEHRKDNRAEFRARTEAVDLLAKANDGMPGLTALSPERYGDVAKLVAEALTMLDKITAERAEVEAGFITTDA